jgi:hypothetical protein
MAQPDHTETAVAQDTSHLLRGRKPTLRRAIQTHIGNELRAMYEKSACEPVPLRLVELMNCLEKTTPPDEQ